MTLADGSKVEVVSCEAPVIIPPSGNETQPPVENNTGGNVTEPIPIPPIENNTSGNVTEPTTPPVTNQTGNVTEPTQPPTNQTGNVTLPIEGNVSLPVNESGGIVGNATGNITTGEPIENVTIPSNDTGFPPSNANETTSGNLTS
jgi:hypothetical protein